MRVAALLSGGKDSVCAIEVARGHGWGVVGAIRVVPAGDDSYMFHTPNLDVVEGIAAAMGLPLETIQSPLDPVTELEALELGLERLKRAWNLQGIISGALASEYQKTRLDRIGNRLGLATFAPLWHKEPTAYLASLQGYDIRFSRVACDGLDESWAGASLDASRVEILKRMKSRPHIAGEGGEYETVVLDAPHFAQRVVVDESDVEVTASRATWHIRRWHLEKKPNAPALALNNTL